MSKHPGGRPPKFESPAALQQTFEEWKALFVFGGEKYGEIPDVEGFCDYTDSYRNLLNEYEQKEEFSGTIKKIKNWIYYKKKQLAMQNKMNPTIFIFDAKNNAGYADKTEVEQSGSTTVKFENLTDEQLEAAIKARKDRAA